jgi:signal transduction histidine kinase
VRRRLLLVLSVFSLVAVAGFALPLLDSTSAERTQRFTLVRTADLDRFAALAQQAIGPLGSATERDVLAQEVRTHAELYDEGVVVVDGSGDPVVAGGLDAADPAVRAAVDAALRNQPRTGPERIGPLSTDPVLLSRPVGIGTEVGGAVVVRADPSAAARDVAAAWAIVAAGALAGAIAFVVIAFLVARWVLRPVAELSGGVRAVAEGRPGAHVSGHAGPPELRELAGAFNRMSDAVASSAEQQRRLVADTSHQLRNPLAALRLRVDTLEPHVAGPARQVYASTVAEVERLEALLDGLLGLAAVESRATDLAAGPAEPARADVPAVVAEQVELWAAAADEAGVRVEVEPGPPVSVACEEDELGQVLGVLIDNAVKYAGADAMVEVGWQLVDAPDRRRHVRLHVRDDGPGLPPSWAALATRRFWRAPDVRDQRGSGLGLAIAERLASTRGGTLRVAAAPYRGLLVTVELPCP